MESSCPMLFLQFTLEFLKPWYVWYEGRVIMAVADEHVVVLLGLRDSGGHVLEGHVPELSRWSLLGNH